MYKIFKYLHVKRFKNVEATEANSAIPTAYRDSLFIT